MRAGLGVSIVGHLAILGFGFVAFPEAQPFAPELVESLPVELVTIAEVTDVLVGDSDSKLLPEDKPQPKPQVQAEAPAPAPAEKPAETPVPAVPAPAPPPPLPPPEPEPEPEPEEVAALPMPEEPAPPLAEEAKPLPEPIPEPPVPLTPNVPRARPEPPKPVAEPRPTPPDPQEQQRLRELAQPEREPDDFNTDDIAALLDKREPAGGGDPVPATEPQTLGSIEGHAEAQMTQSEIAALQAKLINCWNPPVGVREAGALVVTVRINLLQDGSLAGAPQVVSAGFHPLAQIAAETAVRAVVDCAPFGDILRPEKYALWREIDFNFDPRLMLGG